MISALNTYGKPFKQDYIPGAGMTSISMASRKSPSIRSEMEAFKFDYGEDSNNQQVTETEKNNQVKRTSRSVIRGSNIKINDAKVSTKIDVPPSRAGKLKHEINIGTPDSYVIGYKNSQNNTSIDEDPSMNRSIYNNLQQKIDLNRQLNQIQNTPVRKLATSKIVPETYSNENFTDITKIRPKDELAPITLK